MYSYKTINPADNSMNGYWESQWTLTFNENGGNAVLIGVLKVQVGYYEDGNMRLVCSKDVNLTLPVTKAISENYQTMSTTTFKGLRRKLPANCCKIDWNNLISYKISRELKSLHIDKCEGN
ncbi:F-actin-capping protein subunit alpha-2-like [Argonauta hians]